MGSHSLPSLDMAAKQGSWAVRPAPWLAFPEWRFLAASSPI